MPNASRPRYIPDLEDIERESAQIRESWSEHERCKRAGIVSRPVETEEFLTPEEWE